MVGRHVAHSHLWQASEGRKKKQWTRGCDYDVDMFTQWKGGEIITVGRLSFVQPAEQQELSVNILFGSLALLRLHTYTYRH